MYKRKSEEDFHAGSDQPVEQPDLDLVPGGMQLVVKAKVTSATAMPDGELDVIKAALKKRFGREVEVETAIDASLIGGAVIDAGSVVIDGSLKGKLARLQSALTH